MDERRVLNAKICNNGIVLLLTEVRYEVIYVKIDQNKNYWVSSIFKNYISLNKSENKNLSNACWERADSTFTTENFKYWFPLQNLIGFAEDYTKTLIIERDSFVLKRSQGDENAQIESKSACPSYIFVWSWQVIFIENNSL